MDTLQANSFRSYLQQDLSNRCRANKNYSLRSYAKFLRVDASALSRILRNERTLSTTMIKRLGERCGLSPKTIQNYLQTQTERQARLAEPKFQDIEVDSFQVISDWYHWALIELLQVESAPKDPKSLARALGITQSEINSALERLQRLKILSHVDGQWVVERQNNSTTSYPSSATALRSVQKQFLEKASSAIDEYDLDLRDHSTITMSIAPDDIAEAKARIKTFRREMMAFFENRKDRSDVYAFSLCLFPLTKVSKKRVKHV